jgi:hypothetical protein
VVDSGVWAAVYIFICGHAIIGNDSSVRFGFEFTITIEQEVKDGSDFT